jgi:D-glycero-D-manno-heptose 1,7-bisphosphate phosphatase
LNPLNPLNRRVVFLDRDGVINESPPDGGWVLRWEEFHFVRGALEALRRLDEHGFAVVVITNQSCIGRGLITLAEAEAINRRMADAVAAAGGRIAGVYFCPHSPDAECSCRKPKPGLIDQAVRELGLQPGHWFFVGDMERDIEAGLARGCTTILAGTRSPKSEESHAEAAEKAEEREPAEKKGAGVAIRNPKSEIRNGESRAHHRAGTLAEAVSLILALVEREGAE